MACLAIVKLEENMIYGSVFCMALIPPYVIHSRTGRRDEFVNIAGPLWFGRGIYMSGLR